MASDHGITVTWLGHATTKIDTPSGKTILIDPWLQDNPATPPDQKDVGRLDLMLITHGHFDHFGDAIQVANSTGCDVIAIAEICQFMQSRGVRKCTGMNKGGTVEWNGIGVTMVDAVHSSGITDGDRIVYGGEAAGLIVRFEDGFTLYHAGDTEVFTSMQLIGERFQPDVAMLPIGGHFTMDPQGAAKAIRLLGVTTVIPIHWGTFPVLAGTPEALREATGDVSGLKVVDLKPGGSVQQNQLV